MIRLLCLTLSCFNLIRHGSPTSLPEPDEFPFQVSVRDLRRGNPLCSGVLITPDAVLSPASCVKSDELVKITAGSIFASKQNETRTFSDVIIRPGYNGTTNNIAIIKVSDKFPVTRFIHPAKVPRFGTELIEKGKLSGWITVDPDDSLKVFDDYMVRRECKSRYNLSRDQSTDAFCGDYTPGLQLGSLVTRDGVIYGLLISATASKKMQEFVEISAHADWIKTEIFEKDVLWHGQGRNEAALTSSFGIIILLLALFL